MGLRVKLVLLVAVAPSVIFAVSTLNTHRRSLHALAEDDYRQVVAKDASIALSYVTHATRTLALAAGSVRWRELSKRRLHSELRLVHDQLQDAAFVALFDEHKELLAASPRLMTSDPQDEEFTGHRSLVSAVASGFPDFVQPGSAQRSFAAVGEAQLSADGDTALVPIAVAVDGDGRQSWFIAAGLSFRGLCAELFRAAQATGHSAALVEPSGRSVCRDSEAGALEQAEGALLRAVQQEPGRIAIHDGPSGEQTAVIAMALDAPATGWLVVAELSVETARAVEARLAWSTFRLVGLGLLVALFGGIYLTRSIKRPLRQLLEGAAELAKGNVEHRLTVPAAEDFKPLVNTLNQIGIEIARRESETCARNEQLLARVTERTQELQDAQEQLLQSQKIAAVTSLGAGIAHEMNNPLTAVLGLTQVLASRMHQRGQSQEVTLLQKMEGEALRLKNIIATLVAFSQDYAGEGYLPLDINRILDESLDVVARRASRDRITIVKEFDPSAPKIMGSRERLRQAFLHLMTNSQIAMPDGGELTLSTSCTGGLVRILVSDTGKGIAPDHLDKIFEPFFTTKDNWRSQGLGLTVAFRIIKEHNGRIRATSSLGSGTTMAVTLPAAKRGTHLV